MLCLDEQLGPFCWASMAPHSIKGGYYLTYHRWATRKQVEAPYPKFVDFLRLKRKYDPDEVFQSDWYRHYKTMFADKL